jgi:putative PIN family toxin of toxin-antitoxin system
MRVVIDTNIFISSFLAGGNPRKIIDLWQQEKITFCISADIIEEYVNVLKRLNFSEAPELRELLELFSTGYSLIYTHHPRSITLELFDNDDLKFFECAVELGANFIITGDKKILQVREYLGIRVVSPADFLEQINL